TRAANARALADARLVGRPHSAALLAARAEACIGAGAESEAERSSDAAIATNYECGEAHLARANVLARAHNLQEAIAEFRLAGSRGAPRAEVGINLGFTLNLLNRGGDALEAFNAAISWEPFSSPMYGGRAAAF